MMQAEIIEGYQLNMNIQLLGHLKKENCTFLLSTFSLKNQEKLVNINVVVFCSAFY